MNIYSKMKLVMLSAYLISIGGLFFYFSWTGIHVALIMWVLYTIGVSGGYHKLLSHKQFKTGDTFKYFLIFLGTISGLGSSIAWVSQHRLHHRHPDVKDVVIDFTYRYQDKLPLRIICGNSQRMINLAEESLISHSITFSSPRFGIIRIEKI